MSARVVLEKAPRPTWLRYRARGITATEAVTILGLSPWANASQLGVWLDKHNPPPDRPSWRMRKGRALEAPLAAEYARTHPGVRMDKPPLLLAHPRHPWLLASLDYLAHDPDRTVIVECKTGQDWREWEDGASPIHYLAQLQIQLAVTGLDEGVLWADVSGRLEERVITRDDEWLAGAIPILHRWWWAHVQFGILPPLEPNDYHHLNDVWRPEPGTSVEATPAVLGAVGAWRSLIGRHTDRANTLDNLKTQVRAGMGTATELTHPETGEVLAKLNKRGALTITRPKEQEQAA